MDNKHELDGLKGMRNYKGVIVDRIIGGYRVLDRKVKTPQEVDEVINIACNALSGSIVVVNNGSVECRNPLNSHPNLRADTLYQQEENNA